MLSDLPDFIGFRIIVLFKPDLAAVDALLKSHFNIPYSEDAATRLTEVQFGYQSVHHLIRLRDKCSTLPTFAHLRRFRVEIHLPPT